MADDPVLTALMQQLDCYQQLAKLARTQHEHVQHSRTEDLLLVLSQRQTLLAQVAQHEKRIAPAKQRWQEYLSKLSPENRTMAESLLARTRTLLEEITTSDLKDSLVLQQRKFKLGREINQTSAARKFNQVYAAAAYGQPRPALDRQT
jgi:flagellar biosynthesis/type III secretory pathway chaperone